MLDLLGDSGSESESGACDGKPAEDALTFDFDPDAATHQDTIGTTHGSKAPTETTTQPGIEDLFGGSTAVASVTTTPPPSGTPSADGYSTVDQDELRRRIRGTGSEKASSLQRFRTAASDVAGGIRGRMGSTPRWKVGAGLLFLILLCGGFHMWRRNARDASLDDTVIVTEASKVPAKPKIRNPGSTAKQSLVEEELTHSAKGSADASDTAEEDRADSEDEDTSSRQRASKAAEGPAELSQQFASLQRAVADSKEQILGELAALRGEVSRLRRQTGDSKVDKDRTDDQTRSQSRSSSGRSEEGYGEVRQEKPQWSSRTQTRRSPATGTRGSSARSRASASESEDEDEDKGDDDEASTAAAQRWAAGDDATAPSTRRERRSSVGSVGEVVTR